jgi:hypothetical protein
MMESSLGVSVGNRLDHLGASGWHQLEEKEHARLSGIRYHNITTQHTQRAILDPTPVGL